ncbi:hypothetical protein Tsubulata_042928 [Turnera subulata]|uniref:WAT1-related protein n=1 Tax=Turnera subulata TaxID=218843 RepID=A0A9Q0FL01_9ROSI|nr:hypothetical protein Tsubulata_042928 [Turnera subulata]
MAGSYWYNKVLPFTVFVAGECTSVGLFTLFKAATLKGLSYHLFIAYSYAIGSLILLPFIFLHRRAVPASFEGAVAFRLCLLVLVGFLAQVSGYKGLEYGSPTLASVMSNLTPAFTFILAIIFRSFLFHFILHFFSPLDVYFVTAFCSGLIKNTEVLSAVQLSPKYIPLILFFLFFSNGCSKRMEKVDLRSLSTGAKIIGTIVSISGAIVVVLYKGPGILSTSSPTEHILLQKPVGSPESDWVLGGLLISGRFILIATWYIIQTQIMKIYPEEITVAFFYSLGVTICSVLGCLAVGTRTWNLGSQVEVIAVIYSGIFGSCVSVVIHTWGVRLKGPVYVALFKPLSIAVAAFMSFTFLGDALHLGRYWYLVCVTLTF